MAFNKRAEKRRLIAALELAIERSVPPITMPGYSRCWDRWEEIAKALGATTYRRNLLMRVYQSAALRACERGRS
jgi:hypothetical protein